MHGLGAFGGGMAGLIGGEALGTAISIPVHSGLGNAPLPASGYLTDVANDIVELFGKKRAVKLPSSATTAAFLITTVLGGVGAYYGTQLAQKFLRSRDAVLKPSST